MTGKPVRIQRQRSRGWRMPPNTIYVGRPSRFGNPFTIASIRRAGLFRNSHQAAAECVEGFRIWLSTAQWRDYWQGEESEASRSAMLGGLQTLRGKNLACWCSLDKPCHADVLLDVANAPFVCVAAHAP